MLRARVYVCVRVCRGGGVLSYPLGCESLLTNVAHCSMTWRCAGKDATKTLTDYVLSMVTKYVLSCVEPNECHAT